MERNTNAQPAPQPTVQPLFYPTEADLDQAERMIALARKDSGRLFGNREIAGYILTNYYHAHAPAALDVERLVDRACLAMKWLPDIEQQLMADALAPFKKEEPHDNL
jgi:hypothetical protein